MVGGNAGTIDLILVTLRMLRELGCQLPVELWHLAREMSPYYERRLREFQVTLRRFDEPDLLVPAERKIGLEKNFNLKVAAWVNTRFEEFIALDSDVLPVRDPTYLFETDEYKRTGQIFWPDWWKTDAGTVLTYMI